MANKPVIAIDIDDTQFKSFYELFNKYKGEVGEMPEAWKGANEVLNAGMAAVVEQTHNISKNLHTAITAQQQFAKATHVSNKGMKSMAKYAKETYEHIFNMGKFVLKAGAWGTGLFAGAAFGLDKLASNAINTTSSARGLNLGTGQLQSWISAMRGLPGMQDLAGAQAAQSSPQLMGWLGMATGQSLSAASTESPIEFRKHQFAVAHQLAQSLGMNPERIALSAQGMALQKTGMSMQDILRAGNTSQEELNQRIARYRENIKDLDIQKKAYAGLLEFQTKLANAGRALETDLSNKLGKLGGQLGSLIGAIEKDAAKLLNGLLSDKNIDTAKKALNQFTDFLISGKAQADIQTFVSGIETLSSAVVYAAKVINHWMGGGKSPNGKPELPKSPDENYRYNAKLHGQMEEVRRGWNGDTFLSDIGSWNHVSANIGKTPAVSVARGMAEKKYGLIPGTMAADALAESGNNLFAVNGNAAGWYQMMPAAQKQFGVANPFDPLTSTFGAAAQLSSNLALARKLNPTGTLLQHLVMQKAANILGNAGFTRFWQKEQGANRAGDFRTWMRDLPKYDQTDIRRFMGALPRSTFRNMFDADRAGQIDEGDKTLKAIASTLKSIDKHVTQPAKVNVTTTTPVGARVAMQANAAR